MSDQAVVDPVIAEVTADPKVTINGHNAESVLSATQELPEEDEQSNEGSDAKPKKGAKSTFVITSVTYNTEAGPNQEELNGEDEEDESVLNDSTPEIDSNQINNAATPIPSNESVKRGDKAADPASRFKVVKVAPKLSEPYIIYRHRWKVTDFLTEPEPSRGTEIITNRTAGTDSSNSSRASSVHYTPGVDDASKNPLAQPSLPTIAQSTDSNPLKDESLEPSKDNGSTSHPEQSNVHVGNSEASTNDQLSSTATSTVVANNSALDQVSNGDHTSASSQPSPQLVTGETSSEPVRNKDSASSVAAGDVTKCADIQADESHRVSQEVNDLGAALEEIVDTPATPSGDSGNVEESDVMASGVAIDNKIEQAMDLVKSHLMLAVREEVEELRLQIKQLLERNAQLEQENQILRSSASPEILAQLNALGHSSNS